MGCSGLLEVQGLGRQALPQPHPGCLDLLPALPGAACPGSEMFLLDITLVTVYLFIYFLILSFHVFWWPLLGHQISPPFPNALQIACLLSSPADP